MLSFLRNIKRFVLNIIAYAPVLWHDRDYDYSYIYELLHLKLKRTLVGLETGFGEHSKSAIHSLKLAIHLSKRLKEDDYHRMYDRHDAKWGETEFITIELPDGYYSLNVRRSKVITPEDEAQERAEMLRIYETEDMLRNRDRKNLFAIMNKYILEWWD